MNWRDKARCLNAPTELFFLPNRGGSYGPGRAVCAGCPVRAYCLAEALYEEWLSSKYGLRGGTDPKERYAIQKQLIESFPDSPARYVAHGEESFYVRDCAMCGQTVYPTWIAGRQRKYARHVCSVECLLDALRKYLPERERRSA